MGLFNGESDHNGLRYLDILASDGPVLEAILLKKGINLPAYKLNPESSFPQWVFSFPHGSPDLAEFEGVLDGDFSKAVEPTRFFPDGGAGGYAQI
jgi:hypothetical protein